VHRTLAKTLAAIVFFKWCDIRLRRHAKTDAVAANTLGNGNIAYQRGSRSIYIKDIHQHMTLGVNSPTSIPWTRPVQPPTAASGFSDK
jgi:hypothetical protein